MPMLPQALCFCLICHGFYPVFHPGFCLSRASCISFTSPAYWTDFHKIRRRLSSTYTDNVAKTNKQGDHLSGIPGNVREFDSCPGNVRDFTKSQRSVREKILSGKSCLNLFIISCIFASIHVFSTSTGMIWVTLNMPSASEECRKPSGNCRGILRHLESCQCL